LKIHINRPNRRSRTRQSGLYEHPRAVHGRFRRLYLVLQGIMASGRCQGGCVWFAVAQAVSPAHPSTMSGAESNILQIAARLEESEAV